MAKTKRGAAGTKTLKAYRKTRDALKKELEVLQAKEEQQKQEAKRILSDKEWFRRHPVGRTVPHAKRSGAGFGQFGNTRLLPGGRLETKETKDGENRSDTSK